MQPQGPFAPSYDPHIIDGTALFGAPIAPMPEEAVLAPNQAMIDYVANLKLAEMGGHMRFQTLMQQLVDDAYFVDQYDASVTSIAQQTFAARKGNCVAYTNLFVTLAREAGLQAQFQLMRAKPTWDVESGYLVRNNHINVFVDGVRMPGYSAQGITVDFNLVRPDEEATAIAISDEYAASLYYGNRAIEHLHNDDYKGAFAYLKRGIITEPTNLDLWANLGALYNILEQPQLAEQAYAVALQIDAYDQTAIAGIARSLVYQGEFEAGRKYAAKAQKYRDANPYYHYAIAYQAFQKQEFDHALLAVDQAISLKKRDKFFALKAAVAQQLGDDALVEENMRLQKKYATTRPSQGVSGNGFTFY